MRASMHGSLCCVQCFKLMGSAAVGLEERLWYHVHLSGWRSSVSGPTSNAAQLPVATGAQVTAVWRLELYAPPPLLLLHSLESLGCRYHLHYSPGPTSSCLFQSTHLQMYRYVEFFIILVCLVEAPLSSCGCPTGCMMKGRNCVILPAAVVTRLHLLMAEWQDHLP